MIAAPTTFDIPADAIFPLSVEQYHEMIRTGILEEGAPVELLDGRLVTKMTKYPPHSVSCGLTRDALGALVPAGWTILAQEPITLQTSEPEPDVSVVRGKKRDYGRSHPTSKQVGLVVEVADTSLKRDRGPKKRIYARAKIPHYWIVNLLDGIVEVYSGPTSRSKRPDYADRQDYAPTDQLPVVLDGSKVGRIRVADLLP